jgi:hypothetical protein
LLIKVTSEETHSRPASCGIRSGGAVLHVVDQSILDIALEYRFTVEEVQEYYDRCGAMDRTRARFKKMREILSTALSRHRRVVDFESRLRICNTLIFTSWYGHNGYRRPCYSISVNLLPAPRAGAGGELKGFRRLKTRCLSNEVRDGDFAHRSPAAADGNEPNMSGCLGAGASLQQVLSVRITSNMPDAREVRML